MGRDLLRCSPHPVRQHGDRDRPGEEDPDRTGMHEIVQHGCEGQEDEQEKTYHGV